MQISGDTRGVGDDGGRKYTGIRAIDPGERTLLVGTTGSGKSTLARTLLAGIDQIVIVIDPKGDFAFPYSQIITDPSDLSSVKRSNGWNIIYRPEPEFDTLDCWDSVFEWIYYFRDCCVYIDELYGVMVESRAPRMLKSCLTRGRGLHITTIAATQRPSSIPIGIMSESEQRFMFMLDWLDDKKRMVQLMPGDTQYRGREVPTVLTPLKAYHNFYYYDRKNPNDTTEFYLNIKKPSETASK